VRRRKITPLTVRMGKKAPTSSLSSGLKLRHLKPTKESLPQSLSLLLMG